ncbi:hypothetical protein Pelo_10679 [Pelomyxa schiedti]|nr:hypothetical protein Pelo_10679 [Pelomyxa schiedti]
MSLTTSSSGANKTSPETVNSTAPDSKAIRGVYRLKTCFGTFLGTNQMGFLFCVPEGVPGFRTTWNLNTDENGLTLKSEFGKFLCVPFVGGPVCNRIEAKSWEHFFVKQATESAIRFSMKTAHISWLASEKDGTISCVYFWKPNCEWELEPVVQNTADASHNWVATRFAWPTSCGQCGYLIWGMGAQSYQCTVCNFRAHDVCYHSVPNNCNLSVKKGEDISQSEAAREDTPENQSKRKTMAIDVCTGESLNDDFLAQLETQERVRLSIREISRDYNIPESDVPVDLVTKIAKMQLEESQQQESKEIESDFTIVSDADTNTTTATTSSVPQQNEEPVQSPDASIQSQPTTCETVPAIEVKEVIEPKETEVSTSEATATTTPATTPSTTTLPNPEVTVDVSPPVTNGVNVVPDTTDSASPINEVPKVAPPSSTSTADKPTPPPKPTPVPPSKPNSLPPAKPTPTPPPKVSPTSGASASSNLKPAPTGGVQAKPTSVPGRSLPARAPQSTKPEEPTRAQAARPGKLMVPGVFLAPTEPEKLPPRERKIKIEVSSEGSQHIKSKLEDILKGKMMMGAPATPNPNANVNTAPTSNEAAVPAGTSVPTNAPTESIPTKVPSIAEPKPAHVKYTADGLPVSTEARLEHIKRAAPKGRKPPTRAVRH